MYFAKLLWTFLFSQNAVTLAFQHLPDSSNRDLRCYTNYGPHRPDQDPTTTTKTQLREPTSTVTTTVTKKVTSTAISTVTEVFTKTSTIKTASTVAAPKNFVAVQTTLPQGIYNGKGGKGSINVSGKSRARRPIIKGERGTFLQGVTCLQLENNKPKTITTTVTKTVVVSTTQLQTVKTTTTLTTTDYTTTLYAACATNNFVNYLNLKNQYPIVGGGGGQSSVDATNAQSAYDCCVDALMGPHLAAWFNYASYLQRDQCTIGLTDDCPNPASNPSTLLYGPVSNPSQVWGNGYCGRIVSVEAAFGTSSSLPATASSVSSIVATTPTRCAGDRGDGHKHHC